MNSNSAQINERMLQLLADRATEGLDMGAARELDDLLSSHAHYDESYFEPAAAAIDLAMMPRVPEAMPDKLRDRILTDAGRFLAQTNEQPSALPADSDPPVISFDRARRQRSSPVGWYMAAACLLLAVMGWWQVFSRQAPSTRPLPRQYAEFVRDTSDLMRAAWLGQEPGFEGVSGEAVWSNSDQDGFMRLVGLPPNDPEVAQYQLWIVDPNRDEHPIDGGVFDVRVAGEVVVPIEAKLHVDDPKVFAITLEKPGGVVVSAGPLLVVGTVSS